MELKLIAKTEFDRIQASPLEADTKLNLLAAMCRLNALVTVKRAGSGHLGSSLSAMDIVTYLFFEAMNTRTVGFDHPDRDIYFSSKGHDVPGFYAMLYALGQLDETRLLKLRRFGGLDGHPDIHIPGIEANSGSLGMGISKGRGMAWAKRRLGRGGRVYVLTGDGEFQEGQNFEALQGAAQLGTDNLTVIMDHNKVQSDKLIDHIVSLRSMEDKLRSFGWHVARCDGNDIAQLRRTLTALQQVRGQPTFLIADTIKGRGISFMEHPKAMAEGQGYYRWHAGAPADEPFQRGFDEIMARIQGACAAAGIEPPALKTAPPLEEPKKVNLEGEPESAGDAKPQKAVTDEYVSIVYGQALLEIARRRKDLVVLDADLAADCKIRTFELEMPDRFIECGIAEQDMVSMAGGLARQGLLPVVNSFASFLASRANEQIYNNASERTKIIYANHYAGVIPAGPGKSHQSIRDISLLAALPNMVIVEPCNGEETRQLLEYAVETATENVSLRLIIGPSPRDVRLPAGYRVACGQGITLAKGGDAVLLAYGPVMIHEALLASELLAKQGFGLTVVNMPWLNRVDDAWLHLILQPFRSVYVLDDHAPVGGLGDTLLNAMNRTGLIQGRTLRTFAIDGYPACGTPPEALRFHGVDGTSLARRIHGK